MVDNSRKGTNILLRYVNSNVPCVKLSTMCYSKIDMCGCELCTFKSIWKFRLILIGWHFWGIFPILPKSWNRRKEVFDYNLSNIFLIWMRVENLTNIETNFLSNSSLGNSNTIYYYYNPSFCTTIYQSLPRGKNLKTQNDIN